jgi:hypothetical protein
MTLVLGMMVIGCDLSMEEGGNGEKCKLTIVNNNYPYPITEVLITYDELFFHKDNLSITTSQSFTINLPKGMLYMNPPIRVYAEGLPKTDPDTGKNYVSNNIGTFYKDNEQTLYLSYDSFWEVWELFYW